MSEDSSKRKGKSLEKVAKCLSKLRIALYGSAVSSPVSAEQQAAVVEELIRSADAIIPSLLSLLRDLDFEARKDTGLVFTALIHHRDGKGVAGGMQYIQNNPSILGSLADSYCDGVVHSQVSEMLHQCVQHDELCQMICKNQNVYYAFFTWMKMPDFAVCADAFQIFQDMHILHPERFALFMQDNPDEFWKHYRELFASENFVTKHQSLEVLYNILQKHEYRAVRAHYLRFGKNLATTMTYMADDSKKIQYSAFCLFKMFVLSPEKSPSVRKVLVLNRDKLLRFLQSYQLAREDEKFTAEKETLIDILDQLEE